MTTYIHTNKQNCIYTCARIHAHKLHVHLICNNLIGALHVRVCVFGQYLAYILFQERLFCFLSQKETKLFGLENGVSPNTHTMCVFGEYRDNILLQERVFCFLSQNETKLIGIENGVSPRTHTPQNTGVDSMKACKVKICICVGPFCGQVRSSTVGVRDNATRCCGQTWNCSHDCGCRIYIYMYTRAKFIDINIYSYKHI